MDIINLQEYFKYPEKVAELKERLYRILIEKNVDVTSDESLNSLIEKVKRIETVLDENIIYITRNNTDTGYDVTNYTKAIVDVQAEAKENELDKLVDGTIESFTMPSTIENIAAYKFYSCYNLSQISVANATTVASYTFTNCINLEEVVMPECSFVGDQAFAGCTKLNNVILPKATTLGASAFKNCTNLTSFSNEYVTNLPSYGVFTNCYNLKDIILNNLDYISYASGGSNNYSLYGNFANISALSSIYLSMLTYLGAGNFVNCSNLESVSMPLLQTLYGSNFTGTSKLTSLNFPQLNQLYGLGGLNNLQSVSLPYVSNLGRTDVS